MNLSYSNPHMYVQGCSINAVLPVRANILKLFDMYINQTYEAIKNENVAFNVFVQNELQD